MSLSTNPEATQSQDSVQYVWKNPSENKLDFSLSSTIRLLNNQVPVKEKIRFPIQKQAGLDQYIKPSKTIDSDNAAIFQLANTLAKGDDDLYSVVFKLGQWVKSNVKYDLSTLTAEVTQKSSWVLNTREGVCDEITNLFIALNRALGIPARFISGVSYTNSHLFTEKWGPLKFLQVLYKSIASSAARITLP